MQGALSGPHQGRDILRRDRLVDNADPIALDLLELARPVLVVTRADLLSGQLCGHEKNYCRRRALFLLTPRPAQPDFRWLTSFLAIRGWPLGRASIQKAALL
jgi:hypothetical protein